MPYGDYAGGSIFEQRKLGLSSYRIPSADNPWVGSISGGLPIFSGMVGFIQGFQGAMEYERQERLLKKQAGYTIRQGREMAGMIEHEGAEVKGSALALLGKSGTLLEGSPLLALADTQTEVEKDIAQAIEQARINYEALMWQARQAHRAVSGSKLAGVAKLVGNWGAAIAGGE